MSSNGWIGVDLDGTLAEYDHWRGPEHIGAPVGPMVERVKRWLDEGRDVRIFTARVDGGKALGVTTMEDVVAVIAHIERWCLEHIGRALPVTNIKDALMDELYDDRCVPIEKNTGRMLAPSPRGLATP